MNALVSGRVTALVTLFAGMVAIGMALYLIDDPNAYEARIYLCFLGLMFIVLSMAIEVLSLMVRADIEDEARRARRNNFRQMAAPKDWPRS